jgi:co-chaperonin GroES (HSP10)
MEINLVDDYEDLALLGDFIAIEIIEDKPKDTITKSGIFVPANTNGEPVFLYVVKKIGSGVREGIRVGDIIETDGGYIANRKVQPDGRVTAIIRDAAVLGVYHKKALGPEPK